MDFVLPFDTSQLAEAYVTLSQNGEVVLDKNLGECKADSNKISVRLTQEETLQLNASIVTEIQLRVRTIEGEALASDIITQPTFRILKDGVI